MPQLIALRTLQGIGGGIIQATIFSSLGELLSPVARARISGLITAVFGAASVLGPLVGGVLTDAFSWRPVFYANMPFGILGLLVVWRAIPARRPARAQRLPIDTGGALTITVATVLLLLALSWGGNDYPWTSPVVLGILAAAAVCLAGFVWLETRAPDPVVPLRLFRNNIVALCALGALLNQMAAFGGALFIPLFVQGVLGASATVSGGVLVPMVLSMLIVNVLNGLAIAQFGHYRVYLLVGFATSTVGFGLLATAGTSTGYPFLVLAMVVLGAGAGFLVGTLNLAAQNAAHLSEMGVVTSFVQFSRSMGATLGSAVLGSILLVQLGTGVRPSELAALAEMREPLAAALRWVFLCAAVIMASGLVASAFMHEIPMRRYRGVPDAASPTPSEPYRQPAPASGAPRQH